MSIGSGKVELEEGIKLFRNENYKEAIESLEKIFAQNNDVESGYHLALSYAQMQDYDKTLEVFDKILRRLDNPLRMMQAHVIVGYIYAIREMYDLAEFELLDALSYDIENTQIYSVLGYVYYKKKNSRKAIEYLRKALALDGESPNARNSLGFILVDSDINIDEGIEEIKKALHKDPSNPAYLDSLGWAYFKKKDIANAKNYLTKAFEIAPSNKDIKEHLLQLDNYKI
ncbi:tetratricopeptide repeat protein [Brachyspira pilosicoli]|uniref:tetratricopeptide repeat protein n=1 Tax=Brachyspira pilosicoli TaxID=52584 RepID=UPI002666F178|nr:tetratricopeptide repeat protein [Brachyspira pilosicoli]